MNIHVKRNEKWMTLLQLRKVNKLATVTNLLTPPPCLHTDSFPFFPNTFSTFQIRPDDPIQFGSLSFSRITSLRHLLQPVSSSPSPAAAPTDLRSPSSAAGAISSSPSDRTTTHISTAASAATDDSPTARSITCRRKITEPREREKPEESRSKKGEEEPKLCLCFFFFYRWRWMSPPAGKGRGEGAEPDPTVSSFFLAAAGEPTRR
jgi:hypothetical protein